MLRILTFFFFFKSSISATPEDSYARTSGEGAGGCAAAAGSDRRAAHWGAVPQTSPGRASGGRRRGQRLLFAAPGRAADGHRSGVGSRRRRTRPQGGGPREVAGGAGAPGVQTPRPPGLAAPLSQPILRARGGLRDNGHAVLARLATPAEPVERVKWGGRAEPPGGSGKAARGRCRAGLEPSGAADSRRSGGQPGSGCAASDGRPDQWGGGKAG